MKERKRQEKKEATMRENAAEPNAKRAARAESETWTCKIAIRRKKQESAQQISKENRKKEAAVCLTELCYKECGKRKGGNWSDGLAVCIACKELLLQNQ